MTEGEAHKLEADALTSKGRAAERLACSQVRRVMAGVRGGAGPPGLHSTCVGPMTLTLWLWLELTLA